MKKILLSVCLLTLSACSDQDSGINQERACQQVHSIDWSDKNQAVKIYRGCIGDAISKRDTVSPTYNQIDSMLYLSYIYLTDDTYKNINRANELLNTARAAMWQDCDDYHGHYDNFCYLEHYPEQMPMSVENLSDANIIYQMSLPCVYMGMVMENEKILDAMDSYFGSSRDIIIPSLCDNFNPDDIVNFENIYNLDSYERLLALNPEPITDGTMRFGFNRARYHDFVYMLTYPKKYFKSDNLEDIVVKKYVMETDKTITFSGLQLEQEISKHPDLLQAYNDIKKSIEHHYVSFLQMDAADAEKYANMATTMIILQDIFVR